MLGNVVGIDNRDLEKCFARFPGAKSNIGDPYEVCFQIALQKIMRDFARHGILNRVAVIHEKNDYMGAVTKCFEWLEQQPECVERKMSLGFASKQEAVPLQAADILAYEGNKRIRNIDGPERRAWRALNPDRNRVGLDYFNEEAIVEWFLEMERRGATIR